VDKFNHQTRLNCDVSTLLLSHNSILQSCGDQLLFPFYDEMSSFTTTTHFLSKNLPATFYYSLMHGFLRHYINCKFNTPNNTPFQTYLTMLTTPNLNFKFQFPIILNYANKEKKVTLVASKFIPLVSSSIRYKLTT